MKKVPLLILSDSPDRPSGLGRICKDLAVGFSSIPELRVATLGRGGFGSSKLPFAQFNFGEEYQWGETLIEGIWNDFAGNDTGVIMTIWDASRLNWFSQPRMGGKLQEFLQSGRFQRWGYFPIDSYGIGNKLTQEMTDTILGYDRVLAYTIFGSQVISRSIGREVDWIPHGYNDAVFQPREKSPGRMTLGFNESDIVVGCVMTNQERKDWATAFGIIANLRNKIPNVKLWCHVDSPIRHWNLFALANDFGIASSVKITIAGDYNSEQLSYLYSACDATILPSPEGFGFPIVESLACGIPVIHGNYAGGAELVPDRSWLVNPVFERLDGPYNCVRPVWNPSEFSDCLHDVLRDNKYGLLKDVCVNSVEHLQWKRLFPSCWKKWAEEGIQ